MSSTSKPDFEVFRERRFSESFNTAFSASVTLINGYPYVGVSKLFKPPNEADYKPTSKQVYFPLVAWRTFLKVIEEVPQWLADFYSGAQGPQNLGLELKVSKPAVNSKSPDGVGPNVHGEDTADTVILDDGLSDSEYASFSGMQEF